MLVDVCNLGDYPGRVRWQRRLENDDRFPCTAVDEAIETWREQEIEARIRRALAPRFVQLELPLEGR